MACVGFIDDKKNLPANNRFVIQIVTSMIVSLLLVQSEFSTNITSNFIFDMCISVFWIVGITNAFNFIDNLDGAAVGITIIASMTLFLISFFGNQFLVALLALSLFGSGIGFLYWNLNPARIYLGDGGAMFIGVILSVLLIQVETHAKNTAAALAIPILILALPIIDTSVVVSHRLYRGTSVFQGGRDHLSHRLQDYGFSKKKTALILWSLSVVFSGIALLLNFSLNISQICLVFGGFILILCLYIFFLFLPKYSNLLKK